MFFFTTGGECSSVEDPPFSGGTEEEQRQCVLDFLQATPFDAIVVSIDGGPPVNIGLESFLAISEQGTVELPDPNILGGPEEQATFVAGGVLGAGSASAPGLPHDHRDYRWRCFRWDLPGGHQRRARPPELTELLLGEARAGRSGPARGRPTPGRRRRHFCFRVDWGAQAVRANRPPARAWDEQRYGASAELAGTMGGRREWTVSMISALSIPCR